MANDPARSQTKGILTRYIKPCEQAPVEKLTKIRIHHYLIPRTLLISVILVGSLLMALSFPILSSSGAPTILIAKSSDSRVDLRQPFFITSALMSNSMAASGSDINIHRSTSSKTPIASTTTDVDGTYDYTTTESAVGSYWYKAVHKSNNFFNPSESYVETKAVGNVPTAATHLSESVSKIKNVTSLTLSASPRPPQKIQQGEYFTLSGYLNRTNRGYTELPLPLRPVRYQTIYLYDITDPLTNCSQPIAKPQTNENGYYSYTLQARSVGYYAYYASFLENSRDNASWSNTETVIISPRIDQPQIKDDTTLTLSAVPQNVSQGKNFTLSGKLTINGHPVPYQTIYLYNITTIRLYNIADPLINCSQPIATLQTNESGYYCYTLQAKSIAFGHYAYYASFKENSKYKPSWSDPVPVIVLP